MQVELQPGSGSFFELFLKGNLCPLVCPGQGLFGTMAVAVSPVATPVALIPRTLLTRLLAAQPFILGPAHGTS